MRKVVLSKKAEEKLNSLFDYLALHWSIKVKSNFVKKLDKSIETLKNNPESFPESEKQKGLRKYVVTKHNTIFYRFDDHKIYVLTIFETRQHPYKLNKDLK